ncbi:MAG TPA: hypothetical protein VGN00_14270 [Puia sp.]|jgi:hypothetical protein
MRKFVLSLFIAAIAFFSPPLQSQAQVSLISTGNSLAKDTVSGTGVKILATRVPGYQATVGIQVNVTKISGTLAGTILPVASIDGVTYFPAGSGTFTATDVTSQGVLFAPPLGYLYYGVQWTGTGTMSGSITAKLLARKPTQ